MIRNLLVALALASGASAFSPMSLGVLRPSASGSFVAPSPLASGAPMMLGSQHRAGRARLAVRMTAAATDEVDYQKVGETPFQFCACQVAGT